MRERLKGTGCKPVGVSLRWFESSPAHSFFMGVIIGHFDLESVPVRMMVEKKELLNIIAAFIRIKKRR